MEDSYSFVLKKDDGYKEYFPCSNFYQNHSSLHPSPDAQHTSIPVLTEAEAVARGWIMIIQTNGSDIWICPECAEKLKDAGERGSQAGNELKKQILDKIKGNSNV